MENLSFEADSANPDTSIPDGVYYRVGIKSVDKDSTDPGSNIDDNGTNNSMGLEKNNKKCSTKQKLKRSNMKRQLTKLARFLPLLMAIAIVFSMMYDFYTDVISTQRICLSQCTCVPGLDERSTIDCGPPRHNDACNFGCKLDMEYNVEDKCVVSQYDKFVDCLGDLKYNYTCENGCILKKNILKEGDLLNRYFSVERDECTPIHNPLNPLKKKCNLPNSTSICKRGDCNLMRKYSLKRNICNQENSTTKVNCTSPKMENICNKDCWFERGDSISNDKCIGNSYCKPPDDTPCADADSPVTNMTAKDYCEDFQQAYNISQCTLSKWKPNRRVRHKWWCATSLTSIVLSSFLSNIFLMYRLICNYVMYFHVLGFTWLANAKESPVNNVIIAVIISLSCTQLLPLVWLVLLVRSEYRNLQGIDGQNKLQLVTLTFKKIFTLIEDIPQTFLQIQFLSRAMLGLEEGMEDALSVTAIVGIILSCTNAALVFSAKTKSNKIAVIVSTILTFFSRVTILIGPFGPYLLCFLFSTLMIYELWFYCKKRHTGLDLSDNGSTDQINNETDQNEDKQDLAITYIGTTDRTDVETNQINQVEDGQDLPPTKIGSIIQGGFPNNGINIKDRILNYIWEKIDILLFDGISCSGYFISCIYMTTSCIHFNLFSVMDSIFFIIQIVSFVLNCVLFGYCSLSNDLYNKYLVFIVFFVYLLYNLLLCNLIE